MHCTGAGGGGLASEPQANPDLPKPQALWQGEATVADSAGAKKFCPRKGQVFFSVLRGGPGDFKYRIQCSNGAFFSSTATGFNQGGPNYEAYGAHDLSINRTRKISCTIQEILDNGTPVTVATAAKDFTCSNPAVEPGADDLASDPPAVPNSQGSNSAGKIKVLDPICTRGEKLQNGACVKKPDVSILCKPGFVLKGKACIRKLPARHRLQGGPDAAERQMRQEAGHQHLLQTRIYPQRQEMRACAGGQGRLCQGREARRRKVRQDQTLVDFAT